METQKFRDSLIDRAAAAFARDKLDEAAFETFVARIQTAPGEAELIAVADSLSLFAGVAEKEPVVQDSRAIELNMSNIKKRGDWIDARAYRLDGKMSNFELDYLAYADRENFSMTLHVDLSMSNLKLIVPTDWQVDCRIDRNSASNIKDRGPFPSRGDARIIVEGNLSMSNIVVRRRGERRGLIALLFGR